MKFVIPLVPVTKKNSSQIIFVKGRPCLIPSKKYRQYEKDTRLFMPKVDQPINQPINIKALYYMPTKREVDLINLHSALHDVLVKHGVLKNDDSTIVIGTDGSRVKHDKENPRTEVEIEVLEVS